MVVCGAYAIRPYPTGGKFIGVSVCFYPGNKRIAIFSGTRVGRNSIRPTNGYTNDRTNGKMDKISIVRVGRNSIRPTNDHDNGRKNGKMDRILVRFYPMNQKSDWDWIRSAPDVAVRRAYAIRPYTIDLQNGDFSVRSAPDVAVCGAYAIRPYTGDLKNGNFSVYSTTGVSVCGAYAIRPYTDRRKPGWFLVRFWLGKGKMAGDSMDRHPRKGV